MAHDIPILIRPFRREDLEAAGEIALTLWGGEVETMAPELRPLIYHYLARYYYLPDSPYNLAAEKEGRLTALLLAAPGGMKKTDHAEKWIEPRLRSETDRRFFQEYRAYLEYNRLAEENACRDKEVLILFFASILPGSGKLLLRQLESLCRSRGVPSVLLWSDETCDFTYYERRCFTQVDHFLSPAAFAEHPFDTWLFRKNF